MELYFYRGSKPNFGDELNTWMWPRLMEDVWDSKDNQIFLGIGSILFDFFPQNKQKIVFGPGYGGYTPLPKMDEKWKIYFVRGKLTAKALNIDEKLGIGDAAILLRSCVNKNVAKRYKVSFMPHWASTLVGQWGEVCKQASINYIDPCEPVEVVMDQILASELVITEAMHGAIVSDALRVPWVAISPLSEVHSMKWRDWASALDINLSTNQIVSSSMQEFIVSSLEKDYPNLSDKFRRRGHFMNAICPSYFINRAAQTLEQIVAKSTPNMSTDLKIESAHSQMLDMMSLLIKDLGYGKLVV